MERSMSKYDVRANPAAISDSGKVRVGDMSPSFPPARGKPAHATDGGKVRIGDMSPSFPPRRSR
jgi:hypothetical protein